jgi:sialate O-acetylesterase
MRKRATHARQPYALVTLVTCLLGTSATAAPILHSMFQDHAVLQREAPIKVWGRAQPGEEVSIRFADASASVRADSSGHWSAVLPAMKAGGPYALSAATRGGAKQTLDDVLVGDVWLCSGQSNMVLQVHRALDARAEIAASANDSIRLLTIAEAISTEPLQEPSSALRWQKAGPETVAEFSAACLYFARELQKTVNVPMGLVTAAWGGSKIETWMSRPALQAVGGYEEKLALLDLYEKDPPAAGRAWGKSWEAWWRDQPAVRRSYEPWRSKPQANDGWRAVPPAFGPWEEWGVPELASFDGMVWYRTTADLTAKQASQAAVLSLGRIDEVDQTWINGRAVGTSYGPDAERRYQLPRGMLVSGQNVIVVNVLDTYRSGGMLASGAPRTLQLGDGSSIALDGAWQYEIAPARLGPRPRTPWESVAGLSMIYNAMIAPIVPYGLRGVLWYQGEANTDRPEIYERLLTAFMADWRGKFGADLPFLIVQLANYGAPPTSPAESGWARLREAQRLAVAKDAHAGLAIAIDIGERYDIHPANKQDVGRRLARAARRVVYGEAIAPSGPVPLQAWQERDSVVVTFGDVQQRLIAYGARGPIGFELCGGEPLSCQYADADLRDDRVTLRAPGVAVATRVRYCWADSPVCTLYDESRLPAGPFEIAIASGRAMSGREP